MNDQDHEHKNRWKLIHHSFIFWVVSFLMLVAIIYYAMTVDFAYAPHKLLRHPFKISSTP